MPYRLREDLSYCQVDGHLIFLDLENDRYFRLPDRLERALFAYQHGDAQPNAELGNLVRRNILTPASDAEGRRNDPAIVPPSRSAIEHPSVALRFNGRVLLEVFAIVCLTLLQLKTRKLKHLIYALVDRRQRKTTDRLAPSESSLLEAAETFRRARLYVPIETCCLLDSLSLLEFLTRRGLPARLVFGVTRDPFAAHCWVQAGNLVLNDIVGNVTAHTPIREV